MIDKKTLFIDMLDVFKKVKVYKDEHIAFINSNNIELNHNSKEIFFLLYKKGNMNQRNLSKLMGVSPQSISENIKKLIEKKLVFRSVGEFHNENIVALTDKGFDIGKKIDSTIFDLSNKLFSNFTEEELNTLSNLIKKIK